VHFIRTSRHASAILTAIVLVAVGVIVGLTRHDGGEKGGVQLRADQQSLEPSPTITVPGDVAGLHTATQGSSDGPPLTIGKLGAPIHAPKHSANSPGTTATTARAGDDSPGTTAKPGGGGTSNAAAFAPDRIAYSAAGALWTIKPDGTDAKRVAATGFFPAWSPDHNALAYADADSPGGGLRIATSTDDYGLTTGVADDSQPVWSRDGRKIAFARIDNTNAEYSEIWVINKDGTGLRQLTHLSCFNRDPSWSEDGRKLVFWSSSDHCSAGPTQGQYELYTYEFATGKVTRLNTAANSGSPAWSPDNSEIAFASDGYLGVGFEICVMNADGSNAHRITTLSGDDTDPTWSPDATQIAFARDGGIYAMNADGSARTLVVSAGSQPAWY
jgi:Tol biopolymer transport system component